MSLKLPIRVALQLLIVISFFLALELIVSLGLYPEVLLPRPSTVFWEVIKIVSSGRYLDHFAYTISTFGLGLAFGSTGGLILGMLMAELRYLRGIALPYILMLATIPKSLLIPIILKFVGDIFVMKVTYISIFGIIFVSLNVLSSLRTITTEYISMGQVFGCTKKSQIYRKLLWPAARFSYLASLRTATIYSFVGAIVADLLYGPGIGYVAATLSYSLRTSTMYAVISLVALFAISINYALLRIEGRARLKLRVIEGVW